MIAYDGTGEQALAGWMAARPAHLEGVEPMAEKGELIASVAILDDSEKMIGSMALVGFRTGRRRAPGWRGIPM